MAESEIVKAIRRQRAEVARNELDTLRRLARLWAPSYRYLKKQADALAKFIQERRDAGEPVEIEYIYSLQRYKTMAEQARKMIREYSRAAAGQISASEAEIYEIGKQNGQQLISIAEPDDPMWTRVNRRETRIMAGMTANGSPLYDLLNKSYSETMDEITKSLTIGISTGQGSSWIAQQLTNAGLIPEQRALLIARTEVNRAYRQSNWEQMQSSRAIKGYRRMCYHDTACFACIMLDGEFYPVDSEPCDHPNGKCSFVPVTKHFDPINDPSWERGPEWFARQDEETQRRIMGAGRFDLWKQQGVDPRNMVWIKPNDVWGGSPAAKPIKELMDNLLSVSEPEAETVTVNFTPIENARSFETKESVDEYFRGKTYKSKLGGANKARGYGITEDESKPATKWAKGLSFAQSEAVTDYTGEGYDAINKFLRGIWSKKEAEEEYYGNATLEKTINRLDSALKKFTLKEPITVYRTCEEEFLDQLQAGSIFHDNGYGSTSMLPLPVASGNVHMIIDVPAGKGVGAYVDGLSWKEGEEFEFLLGRGADYMIESIERRKDGIYVKATVTGFSK